MYNIPSKCSNESFPTFLGGRKRPKTIHCHQLLEILLMIQSEFTLVENTHFILAVEKSLLLEHNGYLLNVQIAYGRPAESLYRWLFHPQLATQSYSVPEALCSEDAFHKPVCECPK
ncbi:hypothetical protein NC652_019465 [Populus alba x Populus x berolinensis]|nr:hypothetical protein NC652_019465 [Populus alba x Populus x berolinensis]